MFPLLQLIFIGAGKENGDFLGQVVYVKVFNLLIQIPAGNDEYALVEINDLFSKVFKALFLRT